MVPPRVLATTMIACPAARTERRSHRIRRGCSQRFDMFHFRSTSPVNATRAGRLLAPAVAMAIATAAPGRADAEPSAPLVSARGAVAADHETASRVGAAALADGGNAVD